MIKLIGIPYDKNSSFLRGPALAPPKIREMDVSGSANRFSESGVELIQGKNYIDLGDLNCVEDDSKVAFNKIKNSISNNLDPEARILSIGGDHSISYPIIEAHVSRYPDLHVLQIDAHADLYEDFEGNPHSHASPFARLLEKGLLGSLTQVGLRSMTTHLNEQAKRYGVSCIEMKALNFDFVRELKGPLYISLDLDAIDPAFAPGVSHHEPGGLSSRDVLKIIHDIRVPVIGADIVELNPNRDLNNVTAMLAYKLFKELAAKMINN
ncbi:MAG: agmatinase [Flavobacteriaceae bacterium]|nr:agmatinase [Bacteroidia bacterium]NNF73812.1 agmatinase [Flavobacteriaceae bacterium]